MRASMAEAPFPLGKTLGVSALTQGTYEEGKLVWVDDFTTVAGAPHAKRSNRAKLCLCVRNTSAIVVQGKRLAKLEIDGLDQLARVSEYGASLAQGLVVPIDDQLLATGIPVNDIGYAIIQGTCEILLPAAGSGMNGDIADGAPLVCAAGTTNHTLNGGRISNVTVDAGSTSVAAEQTMNMAAHRIGHAMSARTTQETTAGNGVLVNCDVAI